MTSGDHRRRSRPRIRKIVWRWQADTVQKVVGALAITAVLAGLELLYHSYFGY